MMLTVQELLSDKVFIGCMACNAAAFADMIDGSGWTFCERHFKQWTEDGQIKD